METQQIDLNNDIDKEHPFGNPKSKIFGKTMLERNVRGTHLLEGDLHAESEYLRCLVKQLQEDNLKKDRCLSFLRKEREILIDENERLEEEFESYKAERWQDAKRKIFY